MIETDPHNLLPPFDAEFQVAVTLDPSPARQLTSHELAKIFSGMLGGIAAVDPPSREDFVGLIEFSMFKLEHDEPQLPLVVSQFGSTPSSWHNALLATVAGLSTWCRSTDIHLALLWIRQNIASILPAPN